MEEMWARGYDGDDSWLQTREHVRKVLLHRGDLPGWGAILGGDLERLPLPSRYAVWAGFMEVLLSPPFREETQKALATLAATPPSEGWSSDSVREVFESRFSLQHRRAIEDQFHEDIRKRNPRWVEYARGSQVIGASRLQVAADGKGALLWHLPEAAEAPDSACLSVSGMRIGAGELGLVLLLGQDEGVAEGVAVWSSGPPIPFSLRLGAELPDSVIPGRPPGAPAPLEGTRWIPMGQAFQISLRREGRMFVLRGPKGEESHWEAATERPGPGWGIGMMGAGGVLWEDVQVDCPEQAHG
jgi:hypothetical protein